MPPTQNDARLGGLKGASSGSRAAVTSRSRSGRGIGGLGGGGLVPTRRTFAGRTVGPGPLAAPGAVEAAAHVGRPAQDVLPLDGRGVRGLVALLVLPVAATDPHRCFPV